MAIKRILAVRNDRFGEFLLNIPAFRVLKETFGEARLTLVVNPYVEELASSIKNVDEIIAWENKKHRFSEILNFSRELKNRQFDLCVIFNPSKEFNLISFLARIPVRVGYNRKWDFLLTHKIEDRKYLGDRHEVEYNLELVGLIGAKTQDKSLLLNIDEKISRGLLNEAGIKEGDVLVGIHPWTSDSFKQWPIENFISLAENLCSEFPVKIIIVGGREEVDKSSEFFKGPEAKVVNLTGKTRLVELASVLKRCKVLISGDSGPMHLASAMGKPVIAIFRNDIPAKAPRRWGPWGGRHLVIEKSSLKDITVDEVFECAKKFLS